MYLGVPYDYHSIMHLKSNQYSISEQCPTIAPIIENVSLATSKDFLQSHNFYATVPDFMHINLLYCRGKPTYYISYACMRKSCISDCQLYLVHDLDRGTVDCATESSIDVSICARELSAVTIQRFKHNCPLVLNKLNVLFSVYHFR